MTTPWQSQHAEIAFSDKLWPAFDERELDAALAEYARRPAASGVASRAVSCLRWSNHYTCRKPLEA